MTGLSPLAVGIRTFARLVAGVLLAAAAVDWVAGGADVKLAAVRLTLGVVAALVAGLAAAALAAGNKRATTPIGKAIAEFLQGVGAGLATVALADVTGVAAVAFAHQVVGVLISAGIAALIALAQITAEAQRQPA